MDEQIGAAEDQGSRRRACQNRLRLQPREAAPSMGASMLRRPPRQGLRRRPVLSLDLTQHHARDHQQRGALGAASRRGSLQQQLAVEQDGVRGAGPLRRCNRGFTRTFPAPMRPRALEASARPGHARCWPGPRAPRPPSRLPEPSVRGARAAAPGACESRGWRHMQAAGEAGAAPRHATTTLGRDATAPETSRSRCSCRTPQRYVDAGRFSCRLRARLGTPARDRTARRRAAQSAAGGPRRARA